MGGSRGETTFFKINKIKCVGIVKRCIFEKQITTHEAD